MKFFKILFTLFILFYSANFGFSDTDFYFFGKANYIGKTGTKQDYKEGENDFPVASDFSTTGFGIGLTTSLDPVFFGCEVHYNLAGKTTLTDTSDNDTVKINTYEYASGFFLFGIHLLRNNRFSLFTSAGLGISYALNTTMKTYISEYGYETEIEPPENRYPLTAFVGIGLKYFFNPILGILMNTRYQYMNQDKPQSSFCVTAGLIYTF